MNPDKLLARHNVNFFTVRRLFFSLLFGFPQSNYVP
jgi:hypothetical protein